MKQILKHVMVLALLFASITGIKAAGKIEVVASHGNVTTAVSGTICTLTVMPDDGYYITRNDIIVTKKIDASLAGSRTRTAGPGMSASITLEGDDPSNLSDERIYTFTMPGDEYDYKIVANFQQTTFEVKDLNITGSSDNSDLPQATIAISVNEENNVKQKEIVIVDPKTGEETTKTVNVVEVKLDNITIPKQTDGDGNEVQKGTTITIPATIPSADGSTFYEVTEIGPDALKNVDPTVTITELVLPETEKPLIIGTNAFKVDDLPADDPNHRVVTIVTSLPLLADYALNKNIQENFEAGKVKATVTAPNHYWTFSCGVDVLVPHGLSVYTCEMDNSEKVNKTLITDTDLLVNGKCIIKANNGVLVACADGTNVYDVVASSGNQVSGSTPVTYDAKSYGPNNLLEPVIVSKNYNANDYLVLKDNEFHPILDNASMVPACKAVLRKPKK